MTEEQNKPLRVAVFGLDDRSRTAMDKVFQGPGSGDYLLADEASARISIVDMDGAGAKDLWNDYCARFPDRPAIVLSVRDLGIENAVWLRKPVRIDDLLQALREAVEGEPAQPAAQEAAATAPKRRAAPSTRAVTLAMEKRQAAGYDSAVPDIPDVNMSDPEQVRQLFYAQEEYVGGAVIQIARQCLEDQVAREITCWNGRIAILPLVRQVVTDLPDTRLKQFGLIRFAGLDAPEAGVLPFEFKVRTLTAALDRAIEELGEQAERTAIESFIWKLTTWVSRGRIPVGTNLTVPVVLRRWPNMTRLLLTPNALRIAALWTAQPRSLLSTAKALHIPLSHALSFYSAAHALGLITGPKRQVDFLFQPEPVVENQRRGMFGGILSKLLHGDRAA